MFGVHHKQLALTILWIWVAFGMVAIASYWAVKWWRKRRPQPRPEPEQPYAKRLQRRYNERRAKDRSAGLHSGDEGRASKPGQQP